MHFEILVEDESGKRTLQVLIPKIIGDLHTFKVIAYKGIGRIPKDLEPTSDARKRILLDQLPRLLKGYGYMLGQYPPDYQAALFVICDLDQKCQRFFRQYLLRVLDQCRPKPPTRFCFAIEEGEAWLLGDIAAIKKAYKHAKDSVLGTYSNDSICGTWECLADALYSGGSRALKRAGWVAVGKEKSAWADTIAPHMNVDANMSPSFCYFRDNMRSVMRGRAN